MPKEDVMTSKLDEIQARADAATEGPWEAIQSDEEETTTWLESPYGDVLNHDTRGHGHLREDFTWMKRSDAEFIAHAREDVPALVAALKAVEARCDESEKASIRSFARTFDGSLFDAMLSTREIRAAIREALGS